MIELYLSISDAISKVPAIKWTDIGPRIPDHTTVYPAAFVQDIVFNPEETGNGQYYGDFTFSVVLFFKPYHSSAAKPVRADLRVRPQKAENIPPQPRIALARSLEPAIAVRRAIYSLDDQHVQNTVWLREALSCDREGMYAITQFWKATATIAIAQQSLLKSQLSPPSQPPPKLVTNYR